MNTRPAASEETIASRFDRWRAAIPAVAIEVAVLVSAIAIGTVSYFALAAVEGAERPLTPPLVAFILVANLVPSMALLVLLGRRLAKRRAAKLGGGGQLHSRLVALFSVIASVPMLLVTLFASLLFQYGVEFWFSDRARAMLDNAAAIAQTNYQQVEDRVRAETLAMAKDVSVYLDTIPRESRRFAEGLLYQVSQRQLTEAAIVMIPANNEIQTLAIVNPYDRLIEDQIDLGAIARLRAGQASVVINNANRVRVFTPLPGKPDIYLYAARGYDPAMAAQSQRAAAVVADYRALTDRSRSLQLRFNAALFVVSLLIVGLAVFVALAVADRLVRPVGALVGAAARVAGGDFSARVDAGTEHDEIGTLSSAFNRMTERLQAQTNALVTANAQLDSRRALIEAVMEGVSAGVVSIGANRAIRLVNSSAMALLKLDAPPVGRALADVTPELAAWLDAGEGEGIVQLTAAGEAKTFAVKVTRDEGGQILTFDDITQQLLDQRRAAWSDVARRIAHEIKNPLTPIQLAAERLQRRYGGKIESDDGTFARLTDTIVRQVGDLRRMVDEFSSFARMPKPVFRPESLLDLARQALFLHEVARPEIAFALDIADADAPLQLVCDRRQIGQAFTNIIKNAVEAIDARPAESPPGSVTMTLDTADDGRRLIVTLADNGIGLPVERNRIVEPYMTTRSRGTGLGLAIVKKIVEEHFGTIEFDDRPGGGTIVTIAFDAAVLGAFDRSDNSDDGMDPRPAELTRANNGQDR